jgi:lauroyl/myristoyl acyltransferase
LKPVLDPALGALAVGLLRAVHWMDRRRSANFAGAFMRKVGPLLKEHRLGRENLRAAYPEKSDAEIEKISAASPSSSPISTIFPSPASVRRRATSSLTRRKRPRASSAS